jgi:anti-sigma factor RsiW
MNPEMNHERCSELLPALVRGELDDAVRVGVEAHLESCHDCSAERASLVILLALPDPEPLTDIERSNLHRAVYEAGAQEAPPELSPAGPLTVRERRWGARLYPILGAAAVLAIIGTFFYLGGNGGDDIAADNATGGGNNKVEKALQDGGAAAPAAAPSELPPASWDGDIGRVSDSELKHLAARRIGPEANGIASGQVAETFGATNGSEAGDTAASPDASSGAAVGAPVKSRARLGGVEGLETAAPSDLGPQIESCVDKVVEGIDTAVPVYGATATYKGQKVLVLGFLWQESVEIGYDRYMVWAFPIGDCEVPLQFISGTV